MKTSSPCLGDISKDFAINDMKKKSFKRSFKFSSVDFKPIETNDILDIFRYIDTDI